MSDRTHKIVDLFSGAGGFSLGFDNPSCLNGIGELEYENIGLSNTFQTILAVDKYENATDTFENNFNADIINKDIRQIKDFTQWSDANIVIGGPPCQGFSNLNKEKTENLDDDRNKLWQTFFDAVTDIDPDIFLIENVPRFLSSNQAVEAVQIAKNMGYETIIDILWADNYGVPQKRKRGFIFGSKVGTPFFPKKTLEKPKTVRDAIGDLPYEPTDENLHDSRNFSEKTIKRMKQVPEGGNRFDIPEELLPECWKDNPGNGFDLFGRLNWDEPSITIRTGFHKPMKGRHLHPDPDTHRAITLREGARMQTFPDDFEFGTKYQVHIARLIGNAVPPKLSYEIARAVRAHLDGQEGELQHSPDTEYDLFEKSKRLEPKEVKKIS